MVIHLETLELVLSQPLNRLAKKILSVEWEEPKSTALFLLIAIISWYSESEEPTMERNFGTRDYFSLVDFPCVSISHWFEAVTFLGVNERLCVTNDYKEENLVFNSIETLQVSDWLAKLLWKVYAFAYLFICNEVDANHFAIV